MCGINGFNWKDEALIRRMDEATMHRGPDATAIFLDEGVSLGHNRLSIIDLSPEAGQPMKSADGRYTIVYNGEIYNFAELRKELEADHRFKTQGDTEVILTAYYKWGKGCVNKLNGIFAFVIWDSRDQELFLARDHNGIKPLYYYLSDGKFIFSSEAKGILEHPVPRILRRESLSDYLRVLYVPEPFTMFQGIMKLSQASYAVFKDGKLSITKYWKAGAEASSAAAPAPVARSTVLKAGFEKGLRAQMAAAVKRQLVSDRPLGIFLSGGIDSTVVLHHVAELRDKISTYSVGFDLTEAEQREKFNQDFDLARRTAAQYGTDHHEVLLSADDVCETLEKAVRQLDEPIANPTMIPQWILSHFAKQTVDVVLGGDGGDEIFGGYERYRHSLLETYYQKLPKTVRAIADHVGRLGRLDVPAGADRYAQFLFQKDKIIQEVAPGFNDKHAQDFFKKEYFANFSDFEQAFMETDRQTWLVDESLMRTDKMSMSAGLEARVPFLDRQVIEFAQTVPLRYKVSASRTKILVRDAYKSLIPDFIYDQPKRGWFSPGAKWLRNEKIYKMAEKMLSADYHPATAPLFDWSAVKLILADHRSGARYNSTMLWALIIFQIWATEYRISLG